MTQRFGKWLKYLENSFDIWGTAKEFEKRNKYVAIDINILNMAQICGKQLQYIRNEFTMLEMTEDFDPHPNPKP